MKTPQKYLAILLVCLTVLIGMPPTSAVAEPVPSSASTSAHSRHEDLERIELLLGNPAIQDGLRQAGTDPTQLRGLLPRMSDHDIHLLAQKMDHVKTGGVGVVEVLLIVVLVLLIVYLVK